MTIIMYERFSQLPKSSLTALIHYAFSGVGIVFRFGVVRSASMTGQLPQINFFIMYGASGGWFTYMHQATPPFRFRLSVPSTNFKGFTL